jgi:hypothetical protein
VKIFRHKLYAAIFYVALICPPAARATLEEFDEVPVTRWVDGGGAKLKTLEQVKNSWRSDLPFFASPVRLPVRQGKVCCIVVNDDLYPNVEEKLTKGFAGALEREGYAVNIYRTAGGEPEELRDFLIDRYNETSGEFTAILVGDLPVAMFEIEGGFENGKPFPCDLFYMDLDGVWKDEGYEKGVYDVHEGAVEADIRFGRWTAGPLTYGGAAEADLVNHYLDKILAYRAGELRCLDMALSYVDDTWEQWGLEWANNLRLAYPAVDAVYDPYTTWDTDYETRLRRDYEFIQVCVHSNPLLHQFLRPGSRSSYTHMSEIYAIKPLALFYNLFACYNARFTETDYMAGWYAFMDNSHGLAAVGSTKSGGMLHFDDFYRPLGGGKTIGEAFRYWLAKWADAKGKTSRDWHYGMTVVGDPTLRIRPDYIPVLVRGFSARNVGDAVALAWDYERFFPVRGFNLYRAARPAEGSGRSRVNRALIAGTPPMRYVDEGVRLGETYVYELEAVVGTARRVVASAQVDVTGKRPVSFALAPPAPNPASRQTTIRFSVRTPGASLAVYDVKGRKIKQFDISSAGAGFVTWQLDDSGGRALPPGIYIIRLQSGRDVAASRLVVIRR